MNKTIVSLNVKDLTTAGYNRKIDPARVRGIVKTFNERLLGTLLISFRDGSYFIVDGQHRVAAMNILGAETALCEVLFGLTYEEEAKLFFDINVRAVKRPLNAYEEIHGLHEAQDEKTLEMFSVVSKYGFEISKMVGENKLACVSTVKRISDRYGVDNLDTTLSVVKQTWGGDQEALKSPIVEGIAYLVNIYGNEIDLGRFPAKLGSVSPKTLFAGADADPAGGMKRTRIARQILKHYNKNLSPSKKVKDKL